MAEQDRARGAKKRGRRWPRRLVVGWLAVVALLGLVYAFRAPLAMRFIVTALRRELRAQAGISLSVADLSGDWVRELGLHGIVARTDDGVVHASARDVIVRYDLWKLVRGDATGLQGVTIVGLDAVVDLGALADAPAGSGKPFEWPAHLPSLAVDDSRVRVVAQGGLGLVSDGVALRTEPDGEGAQLQARSVRASWPGETREGAVKASFALRRGVIDVESLVFGDGELAHGAKVDFTRIGEGALAWDARLALWGGTAGLRGGIADDVLRTDVVLRDVDLAAAQSALHGWFDVGLTGSAEVDGAVTVPFAEARDLAVEVRGSVRGAGALAYALGDVTGEVRLRERTLEIGRLGATRGKNHVDIEGAVVPLSAADELAMLRATRGRFALVLQDMPALLERAGERVPAHVVRLEGELVEGGLMLNSGIVETPSGALTIDSGSLEWGQDAQSLLAGARIDVQGKADFSDLSEVAALVSDEVWCGSARGAVRLTGGWTDITGFVDLAGESLVMEGFPVGDASLRAEVDRQLLQVDFLRASGDYGEIEGMGAYLIRERRLLAVEVQARAGAPSRFLPRAIERGLLEADLHVGGPIEDPRAAFSLRGTGLEIGGRTIETLLAGGTAESGRVDLDYLTAHSETIEAALGGSLTTQAWHAPFVLDLRRLALSVAGREFQLEQPVSVAWDGERLKLSDFALIGPAAHIAASGSVSGGEADLHVELQGVDAETLLAMRLPEGVAVQGLSGALDLHVESGSIAAVVDLDAERLQLAPGRPEYSGRARGRIDGARLFVDELELREAGERALSVRGSLPLDPLGARLLADGPIELEVQLTRARLSDLPLELRPGGWNLEGDLAASVTLAGTWNAVTGEARIRSHELTAIAPDGETFGPAELGLDLALDPELSVRALKLSQGFERSLTLTGRAALDGDVASWLAGGLPDPREIPVFLDGRLAIDDIAFLARLSPRMRRIAGKVDGSLHVTGTFGAPRFDGVLGIQDGELRLVADVPTLSGLQARIVFSGDDARLEQLEGELGAGSFAITGSVRGLMHDPTLDLGFRGRSILVTRREGLRVRADADLAIDGPLSALAVRGEMRVRDGRYTTNFDILERLRGEGRSRQDDSVAGFDLPSIRRGPLASAEFDVVVRSEEPFRVTNNILRTGLRPDLRLRGTGANPELYGEVFVDPGRLFLPAGTMYLKGGAITLPRDSPIVPRLELTGEARMAGYDIRLRVSGPYDHPIVTLSSTPQLSNSDLTLLVITGRLPQSTGVASQQDTAQNVAVYFGSDLISRWLANDEDEDSESLLERIEWQQGQEVTQNGGRTASVGVRLSTGDPTARRAIYLRGEKDVYDRINYGVRVLFRFE